MKQTNKSYINLEHFHWLLLIFISIILGILHFLVNPLIIIISIIGILTIIITFKYPMFGLIGYLIIFLMRPAEMFPAINPFRIELLIGIMVVLSVILHQKIKTGKVTLPNDRISLALIGFLVAISLSFFTSYEKTVTIETAIRFIKIIVFFYLIISIINTKKRFITFMITFLLLITFITLDAFINYLSGNFAHSMNVDRLTGSTSAGGQANSLGATIVFSIPLILATVSYYKNYFMKFALICLSIFMTTQFVITASRSALLAFIGFLIVGISYSKQKLLNFILVGIFMIIGWYILPQQYQDRYMKFSEVGEDINEVSSGRWEIWLSGIKMIPANPIFGVGAGAFMWACSSGEFGPPRHMQSHNLYIQIISTMGIIGVMSWLFFIVSTFKILRWLSQLKHCSESYWIILYSKSFIMVYVALLISGMFGHNLYRYTWYMLAGLSVAMSNIRQLEYKRIEQ